MVDIVEATGATAECFAKLTGVEAVRIADASGFMDVACATAVCTTEVASAKAINERARRMRR